MERQNPLLPLWYDLSRTEDDNALNSAPRDRKTRDENAGGTMFHTRGDGSAMLARKRVHDQEDGDYKRRTVDVSSNNNSDAILTSEDDFNEPPFNFLPNNHNLNLQKISSRPSNPSSESVYFFNQKVPSSPPINLRDSIESSPTKELNDDTLFTSQATMIVQDQDQGQDQDQDQMVEDEDEDSQDSDDTIDFNINNLNRVRGYISSDFLQEDDGYKIDIEELNFKARTIIAQAIEDGNPKIRLDHLGLKTLPDDIEDLKNMVCVGSNGNIEIPQIEVYASHNKLRVLPPTFFDVSNVTVLSLRHNRMKKLTGKISKLTKLTDLSIASNELKVLPYQILKLKNLTNFLVRPNPNLWELKDQDEDFAIEVANESESEELITKRFVSRIKWSDIPVQCSSQLTKPALNDRDMVEKLSPVPKLSELSLRVISRYKVSLSETKMWKRNVPTYMQKMIAKAIQKGAYEETCSVCEIVTVNSIAKSLEWWDIKSQKLVPLVRKFCCGNCVKRWLDEIDESVEKFHGGNRSIQGSGDRINEISEGGGRDMRVEEEGDDGSDLRFDEAF